MMAMAVCRGLTKSVRLKREQTWEHRDFHSLTLDVVGDKTRQLSIPSTYTPLPFTVYAPSTRCATADLYPATKGPLHTYMVPHDAQ
jgi:hypothetical protein